MARQPLTLQKKNDEMALNLLRRDQLGRDFFKRGQPKPVKTVKVIRRNCTLLDLIKAYAEINNRKTEP